MEAVIEYDDILDEQPLQELSPSPSLHVELDPNREWLFTVLTDVKNDRLEVTTALDAILDHFASQPCSSSSSSSTAEQPEPNVSVCAPEFQGDWTYPQSQIGVSTLSATVDMENLDASLHIHPQLYDWSDNRSLLYHPMDADDLRMVRLKECVDASGNKVDLQFAAQDVQGVIRHFECAHCAMRIGGTQCRCNMTDGVHRQFCGKMMMGRPFEVFLSNAGDILRYRTSQHIVQCRGASRLSVAATRLNRRVDEVSKMNGITMSEAKTWVLNHEIVTIAERFGVNVNLLGRHVGQALAIRAGQMAGVVRGLHKQPKRYFQVNTPLRGITPPKVIRIAQPSLMVRANIAPSLIVRAGCTDGEEVVIEEQVVLDDGPVYDTIDG